MKKIAAIFLFMLAGNAISLYAQSSCDTLLPSSNALLKSLENRPAGAYTYQYQEGCNVNDSVRRRLLELLNWKWTDDEIAFRLKKLTNENKNEEKIKTWSRILSKGNDSLYQVNIDSFTKQFQQDLYNEISGSGFRVNEGIILTVAKLNLKEAVPILRNALKDSVHYAKWVVELALAKFGDKAFQKKAIAECAYGAQNFGRSGYIELYQRKIGPRLVFLATQESTFELHNWLDTSLVMSTIAGRKPNLRMAYIVLVDLKRLIINEDFKALTNQVPDYDWMDGNLDTKIILECKEWLIKNKGKYKLDNRRFWYL